ncbi:MAG: hypothetical protein ACK41C_01165 [Phenylobacterium sp.]|uniref:hypothetical protein n=1 Tax=Phenylobacterium sp. TaxID=1871053 RepID=UPI00391DD97E
MALRFAALAAAAALASGSVARAGETPCWLDHGVVVVAASVGGVAGDYILDTGAAQTQMHETRAQAAGLEGEEHRGEVRLAGLSLGNRSFRVADLDARTAAFPTPIAGVIGADVLSGHVVDVTFDPCRVTIYAGRAPRFGDGAVVPLRPDRIEAVARAAVADGPRALAGEMRVSTGGDAAVRLDTRIATAADAESLAPHGPRRARLRALSFGGELFEQVSAGLIGTEDPALIGEIGPQALSRFRLRFDFPRRRLHLLDEKGPAEAGP